MLFYHDDVLSCVRFTPFNQIAWNSLQFPVFGIMFEQILKLWIFPINLNKQKYFSFAHHFIISWRIFRPSKLLKTHYIYPDRFCYSYNECSHQGSFNDEKRDLRVHLTQRFSVCFSSLHLSSRLDHSTQPSQLRWTRHIFWAFFSFQVYIQFRWFYSLCYFWKQRTIIYCYSQILFSSKLNIDFIE